jgi:hypothetical protein
MHYVKLFSSILDSTLWDLDAEIVKVFITLLVMADQDGCVMARAPGIARQARVSVEGTKQALALLSAPDPESRSREHEGRRVTETEDGWLILNFEKYRDLMNEEDRKSKAAARQRRYIEKQKAKDRPADAELTPADAELTPADASDANDATTLDDLKRHETTPSIDLVREGGPDEERLRHLLDKWNKRGGKNERLDLFVAAFNKSPVDLEQFSKAVLWRLIRYDADTDPKRQQYLGALRNFLEAGKWKNETDPKAASDARNISPLF